MVVSIIAASCSPQEPLINSFVDEWRLLATSGSKNLTSTVIPTGQEVSINPNDVDFGADPTMTRFRNNVYFTSNSRSWIIVYDAERLVYSDTIFTYNELDGTSDICFANATTAYAASPKSQCVGVIDLTTGTVARIIKTPGKPQQIACLGNQICVTLQKTQMRQLSLTLAQMRSFIQCRLAIAPGMCVKMQLPMFFVSSLLDLVS